MTDDIAAIPCIPADTMREPVTADAERAQIGAWLRVRPFRPGKIGLLPRLRLTWLMLRSPAACLNGAALWYATAIARGEHWQQEGESA
jgi:hypothetical protein